MKQTQAERDYELECLWDELEDVTFAENEDGELILASRWDRFGKGTEREEIWRWFDEEHSKGVAYLMGLTDVGEYK